MGNSVQSPSSQSQGEGITEKSRVHSANLEKVLEMILGVVQGFGPYSRCIMQIWGGFNQIIVGRIQPSHRFGKACHDKFSVMLTHVAVLLYLVQGDLRCT